MRPGSPADSSRDCRSLALGANTLVATSLTGVIVGLTAKSGSEIWRIEGALDAPAFELGSGDGLVAVPYFSGAMRLLNPANGAVLWELPGGNLSTGLPWAPTFDKGRRFAAGHSALWAFPALPARLGGAGFEP